MDDFLGAVLPDLIELRHTLHREPELSGREAKTAARVAEVLTACSPDQLRLGIGGDGVVAVFGADAQPTVLLRAELDALPIPDDARLPYCSLRSRVAHKCGHDGHAAMLLGAAFWLAQHRPLRGRVVLLFQPAEETGEGAARVLADPRFASLAPDWGFALHNLPGFAAGTVVIRAGVFSAASVGLEVSLRGATSHAAYPEHGRSPAQAVAQLVQELALLPKAQGGFASLTLLTIIHLHMGAVAFGTSPGEAELRATLRAFDPDDLEVLRQRAVARVERVSEAHGLDCGIAWREPFPVTHNHAECVNTIRQACHRHDIAVHELLEPLRWSEDFGVFCEPYRAALFGIGAGEQHPELHHPAYDFPDAILETGVRVWIGLIQSLTGGNRSS